MSSFTDSNFNYTILNSNSVSIVGYIGSKLISELIIPTSVIYGSTIYYPTVIGANALSKFTKATKLTIPETITTINSLAFQGWSLLTNIIFNGNSQLTGILGSAFGDSTSLSNITIPGTVTELQYTFYPSLNLNTVNLPTSLITIGTNAFRNTGNLIINWSNLSNLKTIGITSFYLSKIQNVVIPASVTSILNSAFDSANFLTTFTFLGITIPTIASNAFASSSKVPNSCIAYVQEGTSDFDISRLKVIFGNNYVKILTIPPIICFKENTKILTNLGYRFIQELRKGDLVKTIYHGFLPIEMIGRSKIVHSVNNERIKDQLYICSNTNFPEVFEDLVITGSHSILVDYFFNEEQRNKTIEVNGRIFITDNKYRLPACVDERTIIYPFKGTFTIYHLALENKDYYMNYGIYANGLLVESCSQRFLKELSGMELMN